MEFFQDFLITVLFEKAQEIQKPVYGVAAHVMLHHAGVDKGLFFFYSQYVYEEVH